MRGKIFDRTNIMSLNIPHDQQLEKKDNASAILTGDIERYIENPAIDTAPPIAPMANGAIAPAERGKNERKRIQNFFSLLTG